jgi:hypothetical protein
MLSIVPALEWLEALPWATAIRESPSGYPILETAHVASIVAFAGLIMVMDLRLLGVAFAKVPQTEIQRRLFPWQMTAFVPSMATGLLLLGIDPLRYYGNVMFRAKLVLLALAGVNALVFHVKTHATAGGWGDDPRLARTVRLSGALSLLLWTAVILSGRLTANNWFS